jgi:hypothetical protein
LKIRSNFVEGFHAFFRNAKFKLSTPSSTTLFLRFDSEHVSVQSWILSNCNALSLIQLFINLSVPTFSLSKQITTTMNEVQEQRSCIACSKTLPKSDFSKSQWKRGPGFGRCLTCVGGNATGNAGNGKAKTSFLLKAQQESNHKRQPQRAAVVPSSYSSGTLQPAIASTLSLAPRPQMVVPGFDNLTVCSDWPQTKRGEPPAQQSAIFMPLLACVIGPVEGHCTAQQLDTAEQWWAHALPAWPRWVDALKKAGVAKSRERLLKSARGAPNPLIPKVKGSHGTIPHFWGKLQSEALERDPVAAVEVYACVTCLYSQRTMNSRV